MELINEKIHIDVAKISRAFMANPKKKKEVQAALRFDRQTMSKILSNKRRLEGGELLTVASVLEMNPFDFALEK